MRASTAFFAGMGTVVVAIASGVSGGAWIAAMMNPGLSKQVMETAHLHRQILPRQTSASGMIPYAAATLAFTDPAIDRDAAAQDRSQAKTDVVKKQVSPAVQSAGMAAANGPSAKPADAPASKPVTTAARRPAARLPIAAPENAFARARDADLTPTTESRRTSHRHWTNRHRYPPRAAQDQYEDQYKQQRSRQAGRGQGNSAQQARDVGRQRPYGRTYNDRRYPGGRYRDENSSRYHAADRRYRNGPEPGYRQYDPRPEYAERPAPFAFPFMGPFGPD
ncbi:MAG: hypothetical protein ACREDL_11035 [Bradyrhizobium sp.]